MIPATPAPEIRDIAPPIDVLPYPLWILVTGGILLGLFLAFVVWFAVLWWRNRPGPEPPSPRAVALAQLAELRSQAQHAPPYDFSIAVSDVLRTFVSAQYELAATRQTSPEFLTAIACSDRFSESDRGLLARFLGKCDMIKFARIDASGEDSAELLSNAVAFVQAART